MGPDRQGHEASGSPPGLLAYLGAAVVEAYPVDLDRKQSVSASELFHGTLPTFLRAGFAEVARPAPARPVVRLGLGVS